MGLMSGKNIAVFGVANKRSIAWGIVQALHREGARFALNFQNERI
jgi:enoyl-[acyl-carrier protein] reductase I